MRFLRKWCCAAAFGYMTVVSAQTWNTIGNNIAGTDYLGGTAASTQPLRLTHMGAFPIEFRTNATLRMRMNHNLSQNINGTGFLSRNGFLGLSGNSTFFAGTAANPGPFSRLHLDDNANPLLGTYRLWMKNGVYMSGNNDMMYVGQLYRAGFDESDAVVAWGDNTFAPAGPDHLRFLFMGNAANEGLEVTRITGEGKFGIGDFNTPNVEPSERLHLYDGRLRIQQLPSDPQMAAQNPTQVMVVDNTPLPSGEHGVVKWRDGNNLDCKWNMTVGFLNHVYTAVGPPTVPCPDDIDAIGIGVDLSVTVPLAKLNVVTNDFSEGVRILQSGGYANTIGLYINGQGGITNNYGMKVDAVANNPSTHNYGGFFDATGPAPRSRAVSGRTNGASYTSYAGEFLAYDAATWTTGTTGRAYGGVDRIGVDGRAVAGTQPDGNFGVATNVSGVRGIADCGGSGTTGIGVYGEANNCTNTWAGYFAGNVNSTGTGYYVNGVFVASDESLKTNIEPLGSAMDVIAHLQPKSYLFAPSDHPHLSMPEGQQAGFLAQEVEEVLPALVSSTSVLAIVDSSGQELSPALEYKAVNYAGMVPYLIAAMQEQSAMIASQNERLAQMEEMLAACCASPTGSDQRIRMENNGTLAGEERLLKIQPNPFSQATTLYYTLERTGRMQLMANSADGKQLRVLHEASMEAGQYQLEWNTTDLGAGVYYVTLLLDGEPIVKKAVKVQR